MDELLHQIPQAYLTRGQSVNLLEKLKLKGQAAFQMIFGGAGVRLRQLANPEDPEHLIIAVDEPFAHLPFDILYTGDMFLWQGFILSRQIATEERHTPTETRAVSGQNLTLIGDPSEDPDLDLSIREELFTLAKDLENNFDVTGPLLGKSVNHQTLEEEFSNCNLLHFSGHFKNDHSGRSGWLLANEELFSGESLAHFHQLPQFVFSNTCGSSGSIASNAFIRNFLNAGVGVFLVTNGEIPNIEAAWFGIFFYRSLLKGYSYGEAVHRARSSLSDRFGLSNLSWMFYVLFGDADAKPVLGQKSRRIALKRVRPYAITLLFAGLIGAALFFLYQRYQSAEFLIHTNPKRALILINGKAAGITPKSVRARAGDLIQLVKTGTDTARFQVIKNDAWQLKNMGDKEGMVTQQKIVVYPVDFGCMPEIQLIASDLKELTFDLTGMEAPELMIQGCPIKFEGNSIRLAVDSNMYRYILRTGDTVYDNAFAIDQDSTVTVREITDRWTEGRYH